MPPEDNQELQQEITYNATLREYMKTLTEHIPTTIEGNYSEFVSSVINLSALTEPYYQAKEDGTPRYLTAEDMVKLSAAYQDVIQKAGNLPKGDKKTITSLQHSMANSIKDLVSDDLAMLLSHKSGEKVTLEDAVTSARIKSLDVGSQELSSTGGSMSSRIPVEYTDSEGKICKGFFTKENNFKPHEFISQTAATLKQKYPEFSALLDRYEKADFRTSLQRLSETLLTEETVGERIFEMSAYMPYATEQLLTKLAESPKYTDFISDFIALQNEYDSTASVFGYGDNWLMLDDGANIDSRNSAMSTMAGLLGMPDIIARAEPMEIVIDGKPVKGTFMENAEGREIHHLDSNDPMANYGPEVYDNATVKKQLSDIQVLDYICGNIDRHEGNFFFRFDESDPKNPKCTGITGIDNDCSFGTVDYINSPFVQIGNMFVKPDDMLVISKSAADAVMSMDRSLMENSLVNYKFTKAELDRCWERIEFMQKAITEDKEYYKDKPVGAVERGHLRIVNDDEWNSYSLDKLSHVTKGDVLYVATNQFATAANLPKIIKEVKEDQKESEQLNTAPTEKKKLEPAHGTLKEKTNLKDPRFADDLTRAKHENLNSLYARLEKTDPWYIRSSDEFAEMKKTLNAMRKINLGNPIDSEKLKQVKELNESLAAQAMSYIALKEGKTDLSDRTIDRLTVANQILETSASLFPDGPRAERNKHGDIVDFAPGTPAAKMFRSWQTKHNKWKREPSDDEYKFLKMTKAKSEELKEMRDSMDLDDRLNDDGLPSSIKAASLAYDKFAGAMQSSLEKGTSFDYHDHLTKMALSDITKFNILSQERMAANNTDSLSTAIKPGFKKGPIETIWSKDNGYTSVSGQLRENEEFKRNTNGISGSNLVEFILKRREIAVARIVTKDILEKSQPQASKQAAPTNQVHKEKENTRNM